MIWHHGGQTDFDGLAVAPTAKEVEVEWTTHGKTAAATRCVPIKSDSLCRSLAPQPSNGNARRCSHPA